MADGFAAVRVVDFDNLQQQVDGLSGGKRFYAFRGYTAPDLVKERYRPKAFVTGLQRVCEEIDSDLKFAQRREAAIAREFMRRAHHHLTDVPAPRGLSDEADHLEWLALMQHHGAPTRLLDWTYSLYVATHFACQRASREGGEPAVWMVNTEWCLQASVAKCQEVGVSVGALANRPMRAAGYAEAYDYLLSGVFPPSVWPVNPFRLNERLTLKRGVFLLGADATKTFAENLTSLPDCYQREHVICFVIPSDQVSKVQRMLHEANVTDATLFPGLDGFARSLWGSARFNDPSESPPSITEI